MFAYCGNNPVSRADFSGHAFMQIDYNYSDNLAILCPALGFGGGGGCAYAAAAVSTKAFSEMKPKYTVSTGVVASSSMGGATMGYAVCLSEDNYGNYAFQETSSLGGSTGAGASLAMYKTYTNAKDVQDLSGESFSFGLSVGYVYMFSVDIVTFVPSSDPTTRKWGITIGVGIGTGIEAHAADSNTTSQDSWTIRELIQTILWGG